MCKMCSRIEWLERRVAYMEGRESTEGALGALARENADLRAKIGDLYTDLKICRKPDGAVMLRPNDIGQAFLPESRVLASHPPVVLEEHRRDGCDDKKC